ncbi:LysR substrate-binding domain-containing protein [Rhizobium sp. BK196]|uniref:LysR substrate-binding domain-containing protein n=1 Tax=Rhizobium sp. BK196 TaxID=2587073 RepID=UPI001FED9FF2|nr:LysR substrate-binding domain-containing protein [Rhizobium sp. BK196]
MESDRHPLARARHRQNRRLRLRACPRQTEAHRSDRGRAHSRKNPPGGVDRKARPAAEGPRRASRKRACDRAAVSHHRKPRHYPGPATRSRFAERHSGPIDGCDSLTCDDTFSLVSLVSAGLGIGFVPEWTQDLPNRGFELKKVRGIDFKIGLGVAWNREDPTAGRDDIIDIARSLVRPGR